jgi:HEAT repeat protein
MRSPVEYAGDLEALKTKLAATRRRRDRKRLLRDAIVPLAKGHDPGALAFLADLARDPQSGVREDAIRGMIDAGPVAAPYVRALAREQLSDAALPWALGSVGSREDAELLLPFFGRRGLRLRYNATEALDELDVPATHQGFRLALRDRRLFVRARAMAALRERSSDQELVEALDAAKRDVPWYRFVTRRYFTLWARAPRARSLRARRLRS